MFKTKLSSILALVAVLSLLLAPAVYADTGTTKGSFGAASKAPTIDSIEIYNVDNSVADSLTPLVTYYAKVKVSSANKLQHLDTVTVTLFYNIAGNGSMTAPGTGNTQTCAILSRTVGGTTWTIDPSGGDTTWQIVSGSCTEPTDLTATTGEWKFYFIPGKVAHEADGLPSFWDAQGLATNKNHQPGELYVRGKYMNCYSQITVTGSVNWGDVPLGLTFEDATYNPRPDSDNISINYIANGDYESDIKSTDWTSGGETVFLDVTGGNPPVSAGQFALKASWHNIASDNVTVQKAIYTPMYVAGTITPEIGTTFTNNRLWLSLSATGILPGLYSGDIWYQIQCR